MRQLDDERRGARLVTVAVLGFLLFNYPLLAVFDRPVIVLGVPLVWLYAFTAWALVIVLVALVSRGR